jgi:hypothetical protein
MVSPRQHQQQQQQYYQPQQQSFSLREETSLDAPLPEFLKPVPRPDLLQSVPSLTKDRFTYLDCETMMGHVTWNLQIAIHSALILKDYGPALSVEYQNLVLRRVVGSTKEIKSIVTVLRLVDTRESYQISRQDALYEASIRFSESTVALVGAARDIKRGHDGVFGEMLANYTAGARDMIQAIKFLHFDQNAREYKLRLQ